MAAKSNKELFVWKVSVGSQAFKPLQGQRKGEAGHKRALSLWYGEKY
jgi:hypothetical protein